MEQSPTASSRDSQTTSIAMSCIQFIKEKVSSTVQSRQWSPLAKLGIAVLGTAFVITMVFAMKYIVAAAIAGTLSVMFLCICVMVFVCLMALIATFMADDLRQFS